MADFRKAMIGKIHVAKGKLGLDEDTYRALLLRVGGQSSCTQLSEAGLKAVLKEFERQGFTSSRVPLGRAKPRFVPTPTIGKIRALWLALHQEGVVRDPGEAAVAAYIKRVTGQDMGRLDGASASKAIEGLKAWAKRAGVETDG